MQLSRCSPAGRTVDNRPRGFPYQNEYGCPWRQSSTRSKLLPTPRSETRSQRSVPAESTLGVVGFLFPLLEYAAFWEAVHAKTCILRPKISR